MRFALSLFFRTILDKGRKLRTPEPELVAEMSGLIRSDNSTVSVSRRWQPRKKRIGGSACRRSGETDRRNRGTGIKGQVKYRGSTGRNRSAVKRFAVIVER